MSINNIENYLTDKKGFTLVEMLVVIAIIGILATIGLISYNGTRQTARDARRKHDLATIRLALALYNDDHNSYPFPIAASGNGPDISTTTDDGTIFSENANPLFPGYIGGLILDPINQGDLYYYYDTNQNEFHEDYVICMPLEAKEGKWMSFYASGIGGENYTKCPKLPHEE